MLCDGPPSLGDALTLLNMRILEEILRMIVLLQLAASAISNINRSPLHIISFIESCLAETCFGTILVEANRSD